MVDILPSFAVGNGSFAFTVDASGLLTYANGLPLYSLSEWGWLSFLNTEYYYIDDSFKEIESQGKKVI